RKNFCHGWRDCTVKARPNCWVIYLRRGEWSRTGNLLAALVILMSELVFHCCEETGMRNSAGFERVPAVVTSQKRGAQTALILSSDHRLYTVSRSSLVEAWFPRRIHRARLQPRRTSAAVVDAACRRGCFSFCW